MGALRPVGQFVSTWDGRYGNLPYAPGLFAKCSAPRRRSASAALGGELGSCTMVRYNLRLENPSVPPPLRNARWGEDIW